MQFADFNENEIKVISFNLKRDLPFARNNKWVTRKELAAKLILASNATIVGVQELMPHMRDDIAKLLKDKYTVVGSGRYMGKKDKNNEDEHADIILNNEIAQVVNHDTFWLSNNPDQCSRATLAFFPRICTVAEIYLKNVNSRIRVFNTHFDHISGLARNIAVRIILDRMDNYNTEDPLPTILMGDLNAKPKSRPVRILRHNMHNKENVHLTDVYTAYSPEKLSNTFHNFKGKNIKKQPIDYMFVSDEFNIIESYIATEPIEGKYPSDHFPVVAILELKEKEKFSN